MRVRHFTSNSNADIRDPDRKVLEALSKFAKWYDKQPDINHSLGADILRENYDTKKYHGLGVLKKYTIMHHLEILNRYLDER